MTNCSTHPKHSRLFLTRYSRLAKNCSVSGFICFAFFQSVTCVGQRPQRGPLGPPPCSHSTSSLDHQVPLTHISASRPKSQCWGPYLSLKAQIPTPRPNSSLKGFGPQDWDLSLKARIWASRLRYEPGGWEEGGC